MKRITLLLALAICAEHSLFSQTNVSGYIFSNTTWTLANSPYIVTGNTLVHDTATLTIEPGVVVKFDNSTALQVDGELVAIGTGQSRITFTATDSTPVRGSWGRIQFSDVSRDAVFDIAGNYASGSILKYCDIQYGGGIAGSATVFCDTSAPYFSHCRISECLNHAIYFASSVGRVDSSSIKNCGGTAILFANTSAGDLVAMNDTLEDNGGGIVRAWGPGYFMSVNIQHCVFTRTGDAVDVVCEQSSIISNNVFHANENALRGHLGADVSAVTTISDNIFTNQTKSVIGAQLYCNGVSTQLGKHLLIANNYFENNIGAIIVGASGYTVRDNVFINNQFNPQLGCHINNNPGKRALLHFMTGKGRMMNNVFDGNTTAPEVDLIRLSGQWEIGYNTVQNNTNGSLEVVGAAAVCGNSFQNNTGSILEISGSATGAVIHHNQFLSNSGTSFSAANFYITGATCTFNNNLINGNTSTLATLLIENGIPQFQNNDITNNTSPALIEVNGNTVPSFSQNNLSGIGNDTLVKNYLPFGPGANINMANNYWSTTNTAVIDSFIFDYFDDAGKSVVLYLPLLSAPVSIDTSILCIDTTCALSLNATVVAPACFGDSSGSINITPANGAMPYRYLWSNSATTQNISSLPAGNFSVTVTDDNFCTATQTFTLTQPAASLAVVSGVVTDAVCNTGGAINITVGGGTSPYAYNWGSGSTTEDRNGLNPGNYTVTITDSKGCTTSQAFVIGQQAGPVINGSVTNASCHNACDGAINLSVSGIPPFTYYWDSSFGTSADTSGLCAGTYNVIVADSTGCGIAATFIVTSPAQLIATTSITDNISCSGYSDGVALAAANGGIPAYSFLWSDGQNTSAATGLSAGTYAVTVTDSLGCKDTASVAMPDGANVFVGVIVGLNSANINQNYVYSVNANFNYAYTWSVNNGILISGQGTNGIEVAWTTAGTGLIQVIAQEQGCADTVFKSVTVVDTTRNCSALFYLYPDTIPHSYFVVNTASGIPQLSYSWNWGDGSAADTVPYPTHNYLTAGFYTICLTITDSAGCTDTYCNPYFLLKAEDESSAMIQVNVVPPTITSIQNEIPEEIVVYPNPTSGTITLKKISLNERIESLNFHLLNALGKEILQQRFESSELEFGKQIDLSQLPSGLYHLKIQSAKGSRIIKILKQ